MTFNFSSAAIATLYLHASRRIEHSATLRIIMPPPSFSKAKAKKWRLTIQTEVQPLQVRSNSDWIGALLLTARTVSTAAESFPYLKGVVGTVVVLLETVETVKKNREALKELCGNVMEIITIVREQISLHGDTAALRFKGLCGDLEE
ncbi:Protein kinase domain-containing protein [Mycena sanguinolenta]|uniref:Protein kinase domain-containing protein n=1 Tax=Mycena sanguinolenta TaxID=230812 RepID=A0A8H6ZE61_9AGAR|nr:Protein kinase domain-containing protein [Mycena sanguinolenta]